MLCYVALHNVMRCNVTSRYFKLRHVTLSYVNNMLCYVVLRSDAMVGWAPRVSSPVSNEYQLYGRCKSTSRYRHVPPCSLLQLERLLFEVENASPNLFSSVTSHPANPAQYLALCMRRQEKLGRNKRMGIFRVDAPLTRIARGWTQR